MSGPLRGDFFLTHTVYQVGLLLPFILLVLLNFSQALLTIPPNPPSLSRTSYQANTAEKNKQIKNFL